MNKPILATATLAAALAVATTSCSSPCCCSGKTKSMQATVSKIPFGQLPDGAAVDLITLQNKNGMVVKVMTYGAIITEVQAPDRTGKMGDVALGYDNLGGYLKSSPYFGAAIGRVGNRIAKGRFTLDGKDYTLAVNNGPNALHGGLKGFDKVVWKVESMVKKTDGAAVVFSYLSKDGEEGYPGNLKVVMTYTLTDGNELRLDYEATTDKATPINLTNHSYWNLADEGDVLGHEMMIAADRFTPVDSTLIPTGEIKSVDGTVMDFRKPTTIGARIKQVGGDPAGYDHNYVLNSGGGKMALAARVTEPKSGRILEIHTDQPGVQFYSGNFLDGTITGKNSAVYMQHYAFCLETQHFPDSVNHANFPTTILKPGDVYKTTTVHKFSAK